MSRGFERVQRLPAEPEPLHGSGAEVLDDHVGTAQQIVEHGAPARVLQVEGEALLVGVEEEEAPAIDAGPVGEPDPVGLAGQGLHLDDLGPQPGEQLRARGAGFVLGQIDDPDTVQSFRHRHGCLRDEPRSVPRPPSRVSGGTPQNLRYCRPALTSGRDRAIDAHGRRRWQTICGNAAPVSWPRAFGSARTRASR